MRRRRPSTICSPQPPSSLRKNTAELDTWPGHSIIDTDYCSSSTSIHSIHCCGREEGGSFVFNRTNPHIWCPWHIGSMNVVFIHMFIQVVNVLTHWSSWRGSEVGTLEIKLQKVLNFRESHRHGHKAELEPGCQGLPHCPWGVGCHCRAYPWGEKLPLTSLYVPCKGSSQHVLSLEIIIIVAIFRRDNLE